MSWTLRLQFVHTGFGPGEDVTPLLLVGNPGDDPVNAPDIRANGYFPRLLVRGPELETELSPFGRFGGGPPLPSFELFPDCDLARAVELSSLVDLSKSGEYEVTCFIDFEGQRHESEPVRFTRDGLEQLDVTVPGARPLDELTEQGCFHMHRGPGLTAIYWTGLQQHGDDAPHPFSPLGTERLLELPAGAHGLVSAQTEDVVMIRGRHWLGWLDGETLHVGQPRSGFVTTSHPLGFAAGRIVGRRLHVGPDGACEAVVLDADGTTAVAVRFPPPVDAPMPDGPITEIDPRDLVSFAAASVEWTHRFEQVPTGVGVARGPGEHASLRALATVQADTLGVALRASVGTDGRAPEPGAPLRIRGSVPIPGHDPAVYIDREGITHVGALVVRNAEDGSKHLRLVHACFDRDGTPLVSEHAHDVDLGPVEGSIVEAATSFHIDDEQVRDALDGFALLDDGRCMFHAKGQGFTKTPRHPAVRPLCLSSTRESLAVLGRDEYGQIQPMGVPR